MAHLFDPGYFREPFRTLAEDFPRADVYPSAQFRVEWGPVFHRGRLDGSARAATAKLLQNWNAALQILSPAITHPDEPRPLVFYASTWAEGDRVPVLEMDFPAGLPSWMREQDGWARRVGKDDPAKRRNITFTVPKGVI